MNISDRMTKRKDDMVISMFCIFNKKEIRLVQSEEFVKDAKYTTYDLFINQYHRIRLLLPEGVKRTDAIAEYETFCDTCNLVHPYSSDCAGALFDNNGKVHRTYEIGIHAPYGVAVLQVCNPAEEMMAYMQLNADDFMPSAPTKGNSVEVLYDLFLDQDLHPSEMFLWPSKKDIITTANERMKPCETGYVYCPKPVEA